MPARKPLLLVIATHPIQYQAPWFRALAERGEIRVRVLFVRVPSDSALDVGFQRSFAWDVPLVSGFDWSELNSATGFLAEIRALDPDVVLVLGWNEHALLRAWWSAWWLDLPLIVRGDSNARRRRPLWVRFLHRCLLSIPTRFLAVGLANAEFYRAAGVSSERIRYAPHFVDNVFFSGRAGNIGRAAARSRWGLSAQQFCVLFAGKFESKKRPIDLLQAVHELPEESRAAVRVLMVGSGRLEEELRDNARSLGVSVIWAGFLNQTEIPFAYAAADVLVLPSDHGETWGLVVNEAMACGVPAIVSDEVGCANDLVRHNETGLVYPVGEVVALSKAIESLRSDPERCQAMGESARALVTTEYTIDRSVGVLIEMVHELSSGDSSGDRPGSGAASLSALR